MFKAVSNSLFSASIAVIAFSGLYSATASAQIEPTARERVLDYIIRQNPTAQPQLAAPATMPMTPELTAPEWSQPEAFTPESFEPEVLEPEPLEPETLEPEPLENEVITTAPEIIATNIIEQNIITPSSVPSITEAEREDSIVRDLTRPARIQARPKSFGYFASASDYLEQRGETPQPRLTLRYDVSRKNAKTAVPGRSSITEIIIGTDYAAISKSPDEMVIYDFKEKRVLNISSDNNSFTNASLYAAAYRAIDTVGKMTDGGKIRTVPLGKGRSLDAFYLESALGYTAGPALSDLSVAQSREKITADFGGERVFSAMLNGPKLEDFRQAYSFIGLLYHSEPVHPAILAELKDVRAAPNAMTFHSYGPKIPDGEIISWTLKSKMAETAGFPLPASAQSVAQLKTVSPLGFVMAEAVAERALGGKVDPRSALIVINRQISEGNPLSAWVSAQSLKDMVGGCERTAGLCQAISKAEREKSGDQELAALIEALSQTQNKSTRVQGLSALKPMITAPDAPSLVLRRAGLALAKTSNAARETAGLSGLDAAELLSQAIARNPYDLLAYQGLAQIQAARGDFSLSWDINDALRAFVDAPSRLRRPIDRAEAQLETRAPGFFPPVDP